MLYAKSPERMNAPCNQNFKFLGALGNLWKASISFAMCLSVCLSVRPPARMAQHLSHRRDFHENIRKPVKKIQVWLKSEKNYGYFTLSL